MKSAYELAMERLEKKAPTIKLTEIPMTQAGLAVEPFAARIEALKGSPERRAAMAAQGCNNIFGYDVPFLNRPETWDSTFVLADPPDYEPPPDQSIYAQAQRQSRDPRAVALDHMLENDGKAFLMHHAMGYANGNLEPEREMLEADNTVLGGSDGGAHVAMICDASMPTFLLTHWARDRSRGPRLPIEFVIKKQTADTAKLFGLTDRGTLTPGMRADINLIDHAQLRLGKPYLTHDLPGAAPRLMQRAHGIEATYVAGIPTRLRDEDTGARPGRLLRSRAA